MQSQRTFNRKDKDEERDRVEEATQIVLIAMAVSLIAGALLAFGAYIILSF